MPNFDEKTGIRYGVISPHSISSNCDYDLYEGPNSTDPYYKSARDDIIGGLNIVFEKAGIWNEEKQNDIRDEILEYFNDHYENPDGQMNYSDKDYDLHISGDNFGIFVMRSPYYTYCRNCSPCAPGAGDLDSPVDVPDLKNKDMIRYIDVFGTAHKIAEKTLCLGPEWFDTKDEEYSRKIPYRVFRVDNDQEVI